MQAYVRKPATAIKCIDFVDLKYRAQPEESQCAAAAAMFLAPIFNRKGSVKLIIIFPFHQTQQPRSY
jgi:hypothetical protein